MKVFILTLTLLTSLFSNQSFSKDKYNELIWQKNDQKNWYEWWYFKVVHPETKQAFYFCYGLVNPADIDQTQSASKSFVSAGSFDQFQIVEQKFKPNAFTHNDRKNLIFKIGENQIHSNSFSGDIHEGNSQVKWSFKTEGTWRFNAMGWTMGIKDISNIFWYPAQANLKMTGWVEFNGERVEFENVDGYQDRNWGRTFPKWWAWIVSNNFKNSPSTKLASGGGNPKVKLFGEKFEGFTIGVTHLGKDYHFRLPDGDKIKMDISFGRWHLDAINKKNQRVVIDAYAPREKFMILPFMTPQGQIFKDYEALTGDLKMKIYKRLSPLHSWKKIADLESDEAGIEFGSFDEQKLNSVFEMNSSIFLED